MTEAKKTVLLGGGTGLIGSRLSQLLSNSGYEVLLLSRRAQPNAPFPTYTWNVEKGSIDNEAVQRADYIINLAGAGIADRPWTAARKQLIIDSRVQSTQLLLRACAAVNKTPAAFLSSSAIGIYGNTGNRWVQEDDPPGKGFLAESCIIWEKAIDEAAAAGIRTVGLRIGVVLSTRGGALEKFLIPLRFRVAGYFGDGSMWYSWIHIDDVCRMFLFALENEDLRGYYNAVAPHPVTNKELIEQLVRAYGKPVLIAPAPAFALRLTMGEMADVVLNSNRISADKIQTDGFQFEFPELLPALQDLLARQI